MEEMRRGTHAHHASGLSDRRVKHFKLVSLHKQEATASNKSAANAAIYTHFS